MKYLFIVLISFTFVFSCQNTSSNTQSKDDIATTDASSSSTPTAKPPPSPAVSVNESTEQDLSVFLGSYVGYFEASEYDANKDISWANLITIFIDSLADNTIYGHSVVAGNKRPFQGAYQLTEKNQVLIASAKEPGDDRYDGEFEFQIRPGENQLSGKWNAYKKLAVSVRKYELEKRSFRYQSKLDLPEDGIWTDLYGTYDEETNSLEIVTPDAAKYNASNQKLTKEMVENMYKGDLEVMRNAIYARHGYSFKNRRMRYVFDNNIDWYMPVSTDVRDQLTSLELENIALIKRYEQHAEAYYDSFGR